MARRSTSTSPFGVSKRESHDASAFYRRFTAPVVCADQSVSADRALDKLVVGDARHMPEVPDSSVALVVTSPPYFAGKEYEASLGEQGVPATYLDYLDLLRDVFSECVRKLEPGGRIAVNVANLGRRPYRSLSADVIGILQDDLRLLLRGEIIWMKQRGSSGSCAWGSFQSPANPVLRDLTERVVVASKGRFDRAIPKRDRLRQGLPSESSLMREDFMENTLDVWEIPAESATRVGHPAPFPIELPARLIDLYTYRGDLVLDPFAGSGTTAVAAVRSGRHYAGYDLDETYIRLAEARVSQELMRPERLPLALTDPGGLYWSAVSDGKALREIARVAIEEAGFLDIREKSKPARGIELAFGARDRDGNAWLFDTAGGRTSHRPGLQRSDAVWKALGKAAVVQRTGAGRLVLLTAGVPTAGSARTALQTVTGPGNLFHAVIDLTQRSGLEELRALCGSVAGEGPA
jgi:modification methylase